MAISLPPRITEKLRPRQCVPEEPTVLECKVEGVPFPEIKWYFNDILLFASEKHEITVMEQVAKLKIAKVTPSDVGVYTCEAKNEAGVATSRTNIILGKVAITIVFILRAISVPKLDDIIFKISKSNFFYRA